MTPPLLDVLSTVWMSHGDRITRMPEGFVALAKSGNSPYAAMGDFERKYFGVQFHPEVHHTPNGSELLRHFVVDICGASPDLDACFHYRGERDAHPRAGGERACAGGCQRRRGLVRGGGAGAQGHRRPTGGRLCGYRSLAEGGRRAGCVCLP